MGCHASKTSATRTASFDILDLQNMHNDFVDSGDLSGSVVHMEIALGTPIEEVYDGVRDGEPLGEGAFGVVRKATHRATGIQYAVKCIQLNRFPTKKAYKQLRDEIWVMCQLDHPSIVRISEVYESFDELFIVQELCQGGDLFDRLDDRLDEADRLGQHGLHFSEAQCAEYVKQMLASTRYLHSKGIVHRDLKLEHFLFATKGSKELRMIDFGFAKHLDDSGSMSGATGTTYTKAPEVLQGGKYNEKFDIWSIGVLAYLLLAGDTPFGSLDDPDSRKSFNHKQAINHGQLLFEPTDKWGLVSDEGKRFIQRLLNRDPAQRPSAAEAMEDPWITDWARHGANQNQQLSSETLTSLISFKESSEMQKLLSEVLSYTLLPEQMSGLRGEFAKIDTSGSGVITLASLKHVLLESAKESRWFLTEHDVEEVFDSIRMSKTQTTIRWHEFLAAGLSMAQYDDRNMQLAFERLDTEHHGFLTIDDLAEVLGNGNGKETLEGIWRGSIEELEISSERITYEDFAKLVKGRSEPLMMPVHREERVENAPLPTVSEEGSATTDPRARRQPNGSTPLPAHTGDIYDGLFKDVTNSPLIAKRTLYRQNRELFLPIMADLLDRSPNATVAKPSRQRRRKANSCPTSRAGLVVRRGHYSKDARAYFDAGTERIRVTGSQPTPTPIA